MAEFVREILWILLPFHQIAVIRQCYDDIDTNEISYMVHTAPDYDYGELCMGEGKRFKDLGEAINHFKEKITILNSLNDLGEKTLYARQVKDQNYKEIHIFTLKGNTIYSESILAKNVPVGSILTWSVANLFSLYKGEDSVDDGVLMK